MCSSNGFWRKFLVVDHHPDHLDLGMLRSEERRLRFLRYLVIMRRLR